MLTMSMTSRNTLHDKTHHIAAAESSGHSLRVFMWTVRKETIYVWRTKRCESHSGFSRDVLWTRGFTVSRKSVYPHSSCWPWLFAHGMQGCPYRQVNWLLCQLPEKQALIIMYVFRLKAWKYPDDIREWKNSLKFYQRTDYKPPHAMQNRSNYRPNHLPLSQRLRASGLEGSEEDLTKNSWFWVSNAARQ